MENENMVNGKKTNLGVIVVAAVVIIAAVGAFLLFKKSDGGENKPTDNPNQPGESANLGEFFSVSTKDLVIPAGGTGEFSITLKNAVGRIDVASSDEEIATASESNIWLESIDNNNVDTKTITVTGVTSGTTTITVDLSDVASFETEEQLTGTIVINVTVE